VKQIFEMSVYDYWKTLRTGQRYLFERTVIRIFHQLKTCTFLALISDHCGSIGVSASTRIKKAMPSCPCLGMFDTARNSLTGFDAIEISSLSNSICAGRDDTTSSFVCKCKTWRDTKSLFPSNSNSF
jgi:hypothetical protein